MGNDNDGPSDEEVSASSQPSYDQQQQQDQQAASPYSPRSESEHIGDLDMSHELDDNAYVEQHQAAIVSPPPPPPPPPPPSSPPPRASRLRHGGGGGGGSRGRDNVPSPKYPMTIEVEVKNSTARSPKRDHHADDSTYSYTDEDNTATAPSASIDESYSKDTESIIEPLISRTKNTNYESFPAFSVTNSQLDHSMMDGQGTNASESVQESPEKKQQNSARGQVLVHYHPQLGDEGYESTLLDTTSQTAEKNRYSRVTRAMDAATSSRRDNSNGHGNSNSNNRRMKQPEHPPKHIYPISRGMHTRAIDAAREEEVYKKLHSSSNKQQREPDNMLLMEGNDEYNNAATRQIRRRVFRAAMERTTHDERRKKMLDADKDVGGPSLARDNKKDSNEYYLASPGAKGTNVNGGYQTFGSGGTKSGASYSYADHEGDKPLTPASKPTTPKTPAVGEDNGNNNGYINNNSNISIPSPPTQPPSYKTLVYNLIAENEPEKLVQIDHVMAKYVGREEELIKKLDLRYRRRRMKLTASLDSQSKDDGVSNKGGSITAGGLLQQPVLRGITKGSFESTDGDGNEDLPMMEIKTEKLSSPRKLTFVKVDKPAASLVRNQKHDEDEELMMPPRISKKSLPSAISDSTKTDVHSNIGKRSGSSAMPATMASLDEDDNNSGMIPITSKVNTTSKKAAVNVNVQNLGNQVINERLMREREERGKVKETSIERAVDMLATSANNNIAADESPPRTQPGKQLETVSPTKLMDPYKLKQTQSYGDGISVITMETKGTQHIKQQERSSGADGDGMMFGFEKRPPNSITVEASGSGSKGCEVQPTPEKLQRVIPGAVECPDEKAMAEKTSFETASKLDNVEARIRARHKLREDEAKKNNALTKYNENEVTDGKMILSPKGDDELSGMESMFREAKIDNNAPAAAAEQQEVEKKSEGDNDVANPYVIESILSSFDEADTNNRSPHQPLESTQLAAELTDNEVEEEIARLVAEKESRLQAEKALALMKAQRELEAERQARLEAEAARVRVEEELQRLKEGKVEETSGVVVDDDTEHQIADKEQKSLDNARLDQELQRLKVEQMALDAESARHKAEEDLKNLRLERSAKDAIELAREESNDVLENARGVVSKPHSHTIDQTRLEAEAARLKAEKELEKLKAAKAKALLKEEEEESLEKNSSQMPEPVEDDEVEKFRHGYEEEEDDDIDIQPNKSLLSIPDDETDGGMKLSKVTDTSNVEPNIEDEDKGRLTSVSSINEPHDKAAKMTISPQPDADQPIATSQSPDMEAEENEFDQGSPDAKKEPDSKVAIKVDNGEVESKVEYDEPAVISDIKDDTLIESPSESEPPATPKEVVPSTPMDDEEGDEETQIHHVARITFEGDPSKGQLSFITGAKVEAHSNQRGPWWLGRVGGRTGWFPASAVVPASEWLSPGSSNDIEQEGENEISKLSGEELNAEYDLIRNPSDDENDSDDNSNSPAKARWLTGGALKSPASDARSDSPPPNRLDPSEMAGLSERLYDSQEEDSRSNQNKEGGRAPTPISIPTDLSQSADEAEETQSADEAEEKPSKAQPTITSTENIAQPRPTESIEKESNVTKESQPKGKSVATKPTPGWRAARDPKTGLVYYFHTGTRQTTWEKPPDFVDIRPPVQGTPRADKSKLKGLGKVMGLFSKKTKTKAKAEVIKEPNAVEAQAKDTVKNSVSAAATSETPKEMAKSQSINPQAESKGLTQPIDVDSGLNVAVDIEEPHPKDRVVEKDFWLSLDDEVSASSDDGGDYSDDESEATETSLFSKTKLKERVGKWAGKIKKLKSPAANQPGYSSFDAQDTPSTNFEPKLEVVAAADNAAEVKKDESTKQPQAASNETIKKADLPKKEPPSPKNEKIEWRSAIDGASGRTYYYVKGKSKVSWQKPEGF